MSIPARDSFILSFTTKDKYGKITATSTETYYGMIEREEQLRASSGGGVIVIGKGMVFSDQIEGLVSVGQEITIDGNTWTIVKFFEAVGFEGYHHTEIVYG